MKFTDGYWLTRTGLDVQYAAQAYDLRVEAGEHGDQLVVHAPTKVIDHRGDTLNRALLTVVFDSPAEGVIRTRIVHHAGSARPGPRFDLHPAAASTDATSAASSAAASARNTSTPAVMPSVQAGVDDDGGWLRTGDLEVWVERGAPWSVQYRDARGILTRSLPKSVGIVRDQAGRHFVHEQLALSVGETVHGLGERFGPVVRNGQSVDIWNADGGTSSEQAYKNVPFYLSDRGYGVFVDDPGAVSFEVASEVVSRTQFSVEGHELTYHVIAGPTPLEVLRRYTGLTGRPPRIPEWSFGLWLSTSFTTDYDEATVTSFIEGMAERDLPLSVFHFDCFWMREFHWTDFEWDPRTFPDPQGMLARLHERDLKVCVWINPYIAQQSAAFAEAAAQGYLLRRRDGSVWQTDLWQAGMGIVDFTNPAARAWFAGHLQRLQAMGVDAFKTDFGERIPVDDVVWFDGSDPQRMHNHYAQQYNACVFEALRTHRGEGEAVVFARSATAGGQQFPVHWGGDCYSTFEAMAETLRGGLSLAASGFAFWSHDIGGFEGNPDPAVFKRWLAFGLLSSHSRLHGSSSYRVPWAFDEEAVDVARRFTRLKMRLMPYLAQLAREAHETGAPVLRPMFLEFPHDRAVAHLDTQYMLGPSLLVAPVFTADGTVEYYVPAGRWQHLLTGEVVEGPGWRTERHGFDSLPLLVRPGTVLPVGARFDRPDYDYTDGLVLHCYDLPEASETVLHIPTAGAGDSLTIRVQRDGDQLTASTGDGEPLLGPSPRVIMDLPVNL
ncbi:alpha-xylosidase [Kineococcus aurantiacus]|uniref:alpha-D-xyloside xylohydrolase n=1 Tax=Kineococcus aurantiacus TaxID=37633 RepID=A0A7Y9J3F0_9ACTN|nr:alpha-D-xyloside xylohydrolase [Kineococcus aurantiacus]